MLNKQSHPLVLKATFVSALKSKNRVRIWYFAQKYNKMVSRIVYPLDLGPSQWGDTRYHMWDSIGNHVVSVLPSNVSRVMGLKSKFDPSFTKEWNKSWRIKRSW